MVFRRIPVTLSALVIFSQVVGLGIGGAIGRRGGFGKGALVGSAVGLGWGLLKNGLK